jgi:predicted ATPase
MSKIYLTKFNLVSERNETAFITNLKETCYNTVYPYNIFPIKEISEIKFEPITIFYGGNGSGKTTLLNIIAEKIGLSRHSVFNSSAFFDSYVSNCQVEIEGILTNRQMLTSDDVFDFLLNIRHLNYGIDMKREEIFNEYYTNKESTQKLRSLDDYDEYKKSYEAKTKTKSKFIKERLAKNVNTGSNGESAIKYFMNRIEDNGLYLLDEPENSLSISAQLELKNFLEDSARFFGCQFVLATHSPILLSMKNAKIYDLDSTPVVTKKWTELENVKKYFDFFETHRLEFYQDK